MHCIIRLIIKENFSKCSAFKINRNVTQVYQIVKQFVTIQSNIKAALKKFGKAKRSTSGTKEDSIQRNG